MSNAKRVLWGIAMAGAMGLALFALLARQATRIEDALPAEARLRFSSLTDTLAGRQEPLVWWGEDGGLRRRVVEPGQIGEGSPEEPHTLGVLAYRAAQERLVEVQVPVWFMSLKESVVQYLLREADFDWGELGLSVADLKRAGPGLVLHEENGRGDALLIWLE